MELQTNIKTGDLKITSPETTGTTTTTVKTPEPDLITRVSQFKKEEPKQTTNPEEGKQTGEEKAVVEPEFDFKEIEKIPDPAAKEYAEKAYKSFQRGFNQKFQEISALRKELESERQKLQQTQPSNWTPEKIQSLMQDPQFVNAAKVVVQNQNPTTSGLTDDQYSALSDVEKKQLQDMRQELGQLKQQNFIQQIRQQDETLKTRYANYEPQAVDIITSDLLTGKVQATREDLWKVYDYDKAVQRAYELGKQDKLKDTQEKVNSMSFEGVNATGNKEIPKAESNESASSYFGKLVMNNIAKMQGAKR